VGLKSCIKTHLVSVCGGRRETPDIPLYILFLDDGVHCFSAPSYTY
jgi:hypothetical protein